MKQTVREICIVFSYPRYTETRRTQLVKNSHCYTFALSGWSGSYTKVKLQWQEDWKFYILFYTFLLFCSFWPVLWYHKLESATCNFQNIMLACTNWYNTYIVRFIKPYRNPVYKWLAFGKVLWNVHYSLVDITHIIAIANSNDIERNLDRFTFDSLFCIYKTIHSCTVNYVNYPVFSL